MKITIDGEEYEVSDASNGGYLPCITIGRRDYYVAESSEAAGKAAREQWLDMKNNDPREFRYLIGDERLIQWACGESDSFGISSFDEFLDVVMRVPEEEFAGYDGLELEVTSVDDELQEELGFIPTVAYRHN